MNCPVHNRFIAGENVWFNEPFGEVSGADKALEIALRGLSPLDEAGVAVEQQGDGLYSVRVRGIKSHGEWENLLELAAQLADRFREIGWPIAAPHDFSVTNVLSVAELTK